jgi:hypothetical protein
MTGFFPKSTPGTSAPAPEEPVTEPPVLINETPAPIIEAFPQTSETMMIIFIIISMAGVFAYRKIAVRKLS